jgi:hypothetical protein
MLTISHCCLCVCLPPPPHQLLNAWTSLYETVGRIFLKTHIKIIYVLLEAIRNTRSFLFCTEELGFLACSHSKLILKLWNLQTAGRIPWTGDQPPRGSNYLKLVISSWTTSELEVPVSKLDNNSNHRNLSKQHVLNVVLLFVGGNGNRWENLDTTLWGMHMEILCLVCLSCDVYTHC